MSLTAAASACAPDGGAEHGRVTTAARRRAARPRGSTDHRRFSVEPFTGPSSRRTGRCSGRSHGAAGQGRRPCTSARRLSPYAPRRPRPAARLHERTGATPGAVRGPFSEQIPFQLQVLDARGEQVQHDRRSGQVLQPADQVCRSSAQRSRSGLAPCRRRGHRPQNVLVLVLDRPTRVMKR